MKWRSLLGRTSAVFPTALSLFAVLALARPAPAGAQSTIGDIECGAEVRLTAIGDDNDITLNDLRPVNAQECEDGVDLQFRILNLPRTTNLIFYASKTKEACDQDTVRNREVNEGESPCIRLGATNEFTPGAQMIDVSVPLTPELCPEGVAGNVKFFFLKSDSDTPPASQAGAYGCDTVDIDTDPPDAPGNLNSPRGERTLTVSWDPLNDETVERYLAFFDNGASTGGDAAMPVDVDDDAGTADTTDVGDANPDCPSDHLRPGVIFALDDLPDGVGYQNATGQLTDSVDIPTGLLDRTVTPVAVAAVDRAGNVGPLSQVACMEIVDTLGLWDVYRDRGGLAEEGCACSALSVGHVGGALPIALSVLGLWARGRRGRRL